ncbi:hypothetical protein SAMN04487950_1504 [Halogranum rubrum]|uniref:ThiS family protein n=1 Tax=Halogranum rubrum TaxID=553466 RepID=A0A1I4D0D2_9EURY|nr:pterin cluster protein [Halogranum rubrum]SFK86320.1 hypothetical protein SAMN04487950_1504 [Halogranum rubrum]
MRSTTTTRRETDGEPTQTTVEVKATGHVRRELGWSRRAFTFEGTTLRDFLDAFFAEYGLREMLVAETETESTAHGWARPPAELPGTWRKNPEGEQSRVYARICINGRFNEHLGGFDAELHDGDRVALIYPFMFCC